VTGATVLGIPVLLMAVWFGVTAFGVRRGSNAARILTLIGVAAPLGFGALLCVFGGFAVLMFAMSGPPGDFTGEDYSEDFGEDLGAGEPAFFTELYRLDEGGWSAVLSGLGEIAAVTAFMLSIAVAVLLLSANAYFRPRPPAPWPAYPPYPPSPYPPPPYPPPPYWHYGPPR
jgi:hypothetical protein